MQLKILFDRKVEQARFEYESSELCLELDNKTTLTLLRGPDPELEDWFFYLPNGNVLTAQEGGLDIEPGSSTRSI